ncbi:MAG: hypothetical protein GYB31_13300 [Bacteroidetes bacterium]|nr:hypothetical protein [Bacteroidota bacterium]
MKKLLPFILFLGIIPIAYSQSMLLTPGHPAHQVINRWDIKGLGTGEMHTEVQPYWRQDLTKEHTHLLVNPDYLPIKRFTAGDRWDMKYIQADNRIEGIKLDSFQLPDTIQWIRGDEGMTPEYPAYYSLNKPILKYFYRSPAYLFEVDRPAFFFRVNPMLDGRLGRDSGSEDLIFNNSRGLELQGGVDNKIFFYTNILETQSYFPQYVQDRIQATNAIPGAGFYKYPTRSRIFNTENAYDYLVSEGYVGFNVTKHVGVQLGHGRNFIGNGYRSLLLSDFGANYFFLKLNWRVWKLHFQNIFAELNLESNRDSSGDQLVPKKYMATHYLSFKPFKNFSVGFFESVVFSRNNQFELQYLNPVILYRTVEQFLGSPDNVLIGINAHWNLFNRFQLYGQVMLDEFKFDRLFLDGTKWWANKYGVQAGMKYIDAFGVDHLDLQGEINLVRPYTYTHRDSSAAYTHYNQPLAHPNGANFKEALFRLQYRPFNKWSLHGRVILSQYGEDLEGENWGSNVLTPSSQDRQVDEGSVIGQGARAESLLFGLELRYQVWHNLYLELEYFYRDKVSEVPDFSQKTSYIGAGVRMNVWKRNQDY